jgi:hypothetical protein
LQARRQPFGRSSVAVAMRLQALSTTRSQDSG